ncbi:Choline/ethanolaminephosphotransferase 1-like [Homarus americanus]|uniref:diacylglycerol cholinephosphotransferase n=1 Tax=Homarus americanus TaxID=6706 RepID=A0A8J5NA43_HOMAM|nr:Choline/ethanolaminephosphotransferase 1-like [Homarus americanus]
MGQLTHAQLRRLDEHKYSCTSSSLMDPMMQKWWCWLVDQCSRTLAPNLITITGLLINIVTSLLLVYYSPDAKQEVPRWACFLCALGLFTYQSLDAIDGKQARRTGTSSPLGELFDHGCDSLSTVFVSIGVCCSVRLGTHPYWMFFQCMMAVTLFYCAHWQTYVSGTLRFGFIDVTEAQFGVMAIHIISVIFGSSFWSLKVPMMWLPVKCVPTLFGIVAAAVSLFNNFKIILVERGAGRNGSTVALPYFDITLQYVIVYSILGFQLFLGYSYMHTIPYSGAGKNGSTVAVAHMTKSEMAYSDASLLGPGSLFLNQYFNCPIPEQILLYIVCVYVIYDLIKYCREVCLEICNHLNIMLFTIVPKCPTGTKASVEKNGSSSKYMTRSKSKVKNN